MSGLQQPGTHPLPCPHNLSLTQNPGDSKSTVDKLSETATSVGQNVQDTAAHYTQKSDTEKAGAKAEAVGQNILDTGKHYSDKSGLTEAGDKASSVGQNVVETVQHEADKANKSTAPGEKTYLEQAQDLAANALNTASKAASGELLFSFGRS
jgi:hypothetical protein